MRPKPRLVMEIGSTKVACLLGQPPHDVLGSALAMYETNEPEWPGDPAVLASAINRALEDPSLVQRPDRVTVGLTHPALAHRRVSACIDLADQPITVRSRDLQRLKAQAIGQTLGVDREALCCEPLGYDGNGFERVGDPRGLPATRLSAVFQVVTVPLAVRRAVLQALEMAGLELEQMIYTVQALVAARLESDAAPSGEAPPRMLLVDIGGVCTDLAVVDRGTLVRTQTLAWGGRHLVAAGATSDVRVLLEAQLAALQTGLHEILDDVVRPERVVVTGRGALADGLVEWIERTTGLPSALGRSPRTQPFGDLSRQVAFSPLIGLLALASQDASAPRRVTPSRTVDRLLERTKRLLVDYF